MNTRTRKPDLERDLIDCKTIKDKVRENDGYSRRLYAALCNTRWLHDSVVHSTKQDVNYWSCSWRYAGGIVSTLRASGGDYLDYYCSGNEGCIEDDIRLDLVRIGWRGDEGCGEKDE